MPRPGFPAFRVVVVACMVLGGCTLLHPGRAQQAEADRKALTRRWQSLRELIQTFAGVVEEGGRRIAQASDDLNVKRNSVYYRMRAIESVRRLLWFDRPAEAMVDLWTLSVQLVAYFTEGEGRNEFGPQQPIAVDVAKNLLVQVEAFMVEEIKEKNYAAIRDEVYAFARKHPISGGYVRSAVQPSEATPQEREGMFSWLPTLSLNPLGDFGKGLGEGAQAILAFGKVADRFTDVVEFMPDRLGWRLELLQYDLGDSKLLKEATASVSEAGVSVGEVAKTAQTLPARVRKELEQAFASLDPKLREVQATLGKVTEASASLDQVGATYDRAAKSIEVMAQKVETTLQTFQKLVAFLREESAKSGPDERDRPFDILDYDQTARSITTMAGELQETLSAFQQLITDERLEGRVAGAGKETRKTVEDVIWTGAVGVVSAFAAILLLLLAYRFLGPRLKGQTEPQALR